MGDHKNMQGIASLTGGRLVGNGADPVKHVATDSRTLAGVEEVIFVAIRGEHHDGHDYLSEIYEKGVHCFLVEELPHTDLTRASFCVVDDSLAALQQLALVVRKEFTGQLTAITGSNGKTIVKEWLYQALKEFASVSRSPRSYNSQLGVPLSLWQLQANNDYALIEAGISMPGEMKKLERMIQPEIGILTNLGTAHQENFISASDKLLEKLLLFKSARKLIFCADQFIDGKNITEWIGDLKAEKISWSIDGQAKYTYVSLPSDQGTSAFHYEGKGGSGDFYFPFDHKASVENVLHVLTWLLEAGFNIDRINMVLQHLEPVEMRLQTLKGVHGSTLVSDVYNSDMSGMNVALDILMQQQKHERRVVILSDVFQSGKKEKDLYQELSEMLKFRRIDRIVCVGEAISRQAGCFPATTRFYNTTEEFLQHFNPLEIADAAVLIKGARKFRFERISSFLEFQVHKTILEVNLNAIDHNLNYYRSLLGSDTRIMAMVKALSYGSGGVDIAQVLQHQGVDYLAVAFADEGIQLRTAGVTLPIMVMNAALSEYRTLLEFNLEPEIYGKEALLQYARSAEYHGISRAPLHLKLDTGMHRLGFMEEEMDWLGEQLAKQNLEVKSVFTHLVASDDPEQDQFTHEQLKRFESMLNRLGKHIPQSALKHVLNSAGIERFPEYHFNMVRLGIGLYGEGGTGQLMPVSTFKTAISQLRKVRAGETVGYNRSGVVTRDSLIATIPVGYADGIDRRLGNANYSFLLKGEKVPTIGDICMDMTMLDVTGMNVKIGDELVLFGEDLPAAGMADVLGTIVYEILTRIPERVKRIYTRE